MTKDLDIRLDKSACADDLPKVRMVISDSIHLVAQSDWEKILGGRNFFLSIPFLRGLERPMDGDMEFRYVLYYCEEFNPIGLAYFQVADLVDTGSRYRDMVKKLGSGIGSRIVRDLRLRSLVNGNVFLCGEHGFSFIEGISRSQQLDIVEQTMQRIKRDGDLESDVSIVLFKEFWPESFPITETLIDKRYHMFRMDMNMVLDMQSHWTNIDAYLGDFTSKARTRVKAIMKRSCALEFRDMSLTEIREQHEVLDSLFHEVLKGSSFTFGVLKMEVYASWKEELGDALIFQGVYHEDRLVGFISLFHHEQELDVHYVGIDYSRNEELMIYQRMLVHLVEIGIDLKVKRISFGRTAEQAKSSLGAVPVEMRLYTKHRNLIANRLITPVMNAVVPTQFEHRNPFKQKPA